MDRYGLWIAGSEHAGSGKRIMVMNPYDGSVVAEVDGASDVEVIKAVEVATRTFRNNMKVMPAYERARILRNAAQLVVERKEELVRSVVREVGKPIRDARREVSRAAELFDMAADLSRHIEGEFLPMDVVPGGENRWGFALRVPVGVVAAITPFNSPINLTTNKIAPALAAGNTVIVKPASKTPVSVLMLGRILRDAGLPDGALNIIPGSGAEVVDPLASDPRVSLVTFTGGTDAGARIHGIAGLKKVTLELGSSAANIVCADADIPASAKSLATSAYLSSGQACIAAQRLIVEESIVNEFTEAIIPIMEGMRIGDPMDEGTEIGPMVSEQELQRALSWIADARASGANVLTGGERFENTVRPTLLTHVASGSSIACEEAFAPVATLQTFNSVEEAAAIANDSIYGLQSGVFTRSLDNMLFFAKELDVGGVWINESSRYRQDNYPFGGMKMSGLGREGVKYAINDMTDLRFVGVKSGASEGIL